MSVLNLKPESPFYTGLTRIERRSNETPEQFDSTKDTAIFSVGQDSHKLILDGKIDDVLLKGLNPLTGDRLLTDLRDLSGKNASIREACLQSKNPLADAEVDLGTGRAWAAFPNFDSNHQIYGYDLISGCGPQTLSVVLEENGAIDVCVNSKNSATQVDHVMRGKLAADGHCTPFLEGVNWQIAR